MKHVPQVLEIKDIIEETPTIKTFIFDWTMIGEKIPSPGQFVMVWNFHDEKPCWLLEEESEWLLLLRLLKKL